MEKTEFKFVNRSYERNNTFDISSEDLALEVQKYKDAGGKIKMINKPYKNQVENIGEK